MKNFLNYDFNITNIVISMYVAPGTGNPIHKNRPSHGLAIYLPNNTNPSRKFVFSDNKIITVEQNEIIYLPKGSNYTVHSEPLGSCYAINFDIAEDVDFEPFVLKPKNPTSFIAEFEKTTMLWKNRNTAYHMQCKSILYNILSMMQTEYNTNYMAHSTASLIAPAVEYINNNYTDDDINITKLSAMCGISESYFRQIFKNVFLISPRKYINELKLSYSKELIKSGMYTVTEAAELSGYTDMSYFSREFKKAFGINPSGVRKDI